MKYKSAVLFGLCFTLTLLACGGGGGRDSVPEIESFQVLEIAPLETKLLSTNGMKARFVGKARNAIQGILYEEGWEPEGIPIDDPNSEWSRDVPVTQRPSDWCFKVWDHANRDTKKCVRVDAEDDNPEDPVSPNDPEPQPEPACSDGVDNDGDGTIDLDDSGCTNTLDTDETDPVTPPPQDACVENPGTMIAGNNNLANHLGQVAVFGEDAVYTTRTESNLENTHSKLVIARSTNSGVTFSTSMFVEFDHSPTVQNGDLSGLLHVAENGSLNLIWTKVADSPPDQQFVFFNRSADGGITWSENRRVPIPVGDVASTPMLVGQATNLYFFYQTGARNILLNTSSDNGATWKEAKQVYENTNASVNPVGAFTDNTGKVYVFFNEFTDTEGYSSFATSVDNGTTWNITRVLRGGGFQEVVDPINGMIYQLYADGTGTMYLRKSTDLMNWTIMGILSGEVTSSFTTYNLFRHGSGFSVVGMSGYCSSTEGKTLQSILKSDSQDGQSWSSPAKIQTLGTGGNPWDTFSVDLTPSGKAHVLWGLEHGPGINLNASDVWYMREP